MGRQESTRERGSWEARRRITIPALDQEADVKRMEAELGEMEGLHRLDFNMAKKQMTVDYDASRLSYQMIVDRLENIGFPASDSWWSRIKGGWYQYADSNLRDNAKAPPPTCCNKPPKY